MSLFPTADRERIIGVMATTYPSTATIHRYSATETGEGITEIWTPDATTTACRLRVADPQPAEGVSANQLRASTSWWVTFPVGTLITPHDRIVVEGHTLEVVQDESLHSWEVAVRVFCLEIL